MCVRHWAAARSRGRRLIAFLNEQHGIDTGLSNTPLGKRPVLCTDICNHDMAQH